MAACQAVLSPAGFTLLSARTTRAMLFGFTSGLEAPLSQEVAVLSPNLIETFKGNSRQMQFFRAACSRARFAACQAGPGTGKTELLASLAVNYAVASQRVLVVAPSWKAVEVLARRIVDKERSSSFSVCIWSRWSRGRWAERPDRSHYVRWCFESEQSIWQFSSLNDGRSWCRNRWSVLGYHALWAKAWSAQIGARWRRLSTRPLRGFRCPHEDQSVRFRFECSHLSWRLSGEAGCLLSLSKHSNQTRIPFGDWRGDHGASGFATWSWKWDPQAALLPGEVGNFMDQSRRSFMGIGQCEGWIG